MTMGQVLWSPRQDSWTGENEYPVLCTKYLVTSQSGCSITSTAGLAPNGIEGLFFAIGSSRALLAPLGDIMMGMLNEQYNPNCPVRQHYFLPNKIHYGFQAT